MPTRLRIVTYNVLADAYVNPDWYPHTPAATCGCMSSAHRTTCGQSWC